jgi:hypothetical protein
MHGHSTHPGHGLQGRTPRRQAVRHCRWPGPAWSVEAVSRGIQCTMAVQQRGTATCMVAQSACWPWLTLLTGELQRLSGGSRGGRAGARPPLWFGPLQQFAAGAAANFSANFDYFRQLAKEAYLVFAQCSE